MWGLEPRFEPGDIVARGFADLGFEEFQVLPSSQLLSLTAGTVSRIPEDHRGHFFWIPSADEAIDWLEARGVVIRECVRNDGRSWTMTLQQPDGVVREVRGESLHEVVLRALHAILQGSK